MSFILSTTLVICAILARILGKFNILLVPLAWSAR